MRKTGHVVYVKLRDVFNCKASGFVEEGWEGPLETCIYRASGPKELFYYPSSLYLTIRLLPPPLLVPFNT